MTEKNLDRNSIEELMHDTEQMKREAETSCLPDPEVEAEEMIGTYEDSADLIKALIHMDRESAKKLAELISHRHASIHGILPILHDEYVRMIKAFR